MANESQNTCIGFICISHVIFRSKIYISFSVSRYTSLLYKPLKSESFETFLFFTELY